MQHTQRGGGAKDVLLTLYFSSLPQIMILTSIFICNTFYNYFSFNFSLYADEVSGLFSFSLLNFLAQEPYIFLA
jgi:hypothetical protein